MAKENKNIDDFEDDGRTVANMNVDGMPWYIDKAKQKASAEDDLQLTGKEKRAMTLGVLSAALLVCGVLALAYFLFLLFCTEVWLA